MDDRLGRGLCLLDGSVRHRLGLCTRNGRGQSRFPAGADQPRLEPGDAELEPLDALAGAHRHDNADDGENRDGKNGDDDRGDHAGSGLDAQEGRLSSLSGGLRGS
jgi:hypothetical protein